MKKVNVSTKYLYRFAGKWVAIDYAKERIIAVAKTVKEIEPLVKGKKLEKIKAAALKVPTAKEARHLIL